MATSEAEKITQEEKAEFLWEILGQACEEETPFADHLLGYMHASRKGQRDEKWYFEVRRGNEIYMVEMTRVS